MMKSDRHNVKKTAQQTAVLWVAACGRQDSEDVHFQQRFCFASSTLTVVKSLVCSSHSWGCQTAPPVILLTHAHTISVSVFLYSALRRFTVRNKALSRPYLPPIQLCPLNTSSNLLVFSSGFCSLTLSHQTQTH